MCSLTVDVLLGGAFACCLFCFLITESGPGLYDRNANANTNTCGPNPHKNQGFDLFRWHFFCFVLTSSLLSLKRIYILHEHGEVFTLLLPVGHFTSQHFSFFIFHFCPRFSFSWFPVWICFLKWSLFVCLSICVFFILIFRVFVKRKFQINVKNKFLQTW